MAREASGGCQCGRIRYRVRIENDDAYLCHCRMCQRATGGVAAALVAVDLAGLVWEREPERYASSLIARRGFCAACGTPLSYEGDGPGGTDLTVGSFDDPSPFHPIAHYSVESRHEAWVDTSALPATRTEEQPSTVAKWMAACGKLPD